ncbi:kinase-like domain-containing protein [Xylaria bambusicola]|uniref:kinase-like domain-containing protein n=1 Tax=Xylaria bambusicola TaxID=326684 RepID=UPI0020089927|nr:kinase-like domain-containing protein [Xylaria bambusicola]KAI0502738.1 kinase-like domain-containing protein [Xylaria bambusicola]
MAVDPRENTIFEIHSFSDFIGDPHHGRFLVSDEIPTYVHDAYTPQSPLSPREDYRDTTPVPEETPLAPFLRITTDHPPISAFRGFMFGSDEASCDILLAHSRFGGVSAAHFSLQPQINDGARVLILKSHSRNGTYISANEGFNTILTTQRAIIEHDGDIDIKIGRLYFTILFPARGPYQDQWDRNWEAYCDKYAYTGPIRTFRLSSGSAMETIPWQDRYFCGIRLGTGSFGIVYHVLERVTGEVRAAKCFYKNADRCETNLKVLLSLNHSNIVKYYEICNDPPALIMEYIDGPELGVSCRESALSYQEIQDVTRQLSGAIAYLHGKNITHRDLKPSNILVKRRNPVEVKIADFGLASERPGALGTIAGTRPYQAPEILAKGPYTNKVDVWSLGVIILKLSYGYPPERIDEVSDWPRCLIRHIRAQSPNEVQEYIKSLLEYEPSRRPSAEEARNANFPIFGTDRQTWDKILHGRRSSKAPRKEPEEEETERTVKPPAARGSVQSGETTVAHTPGRMAEYERTAVPAHHGRSAVHLHEESEGPTNRSTRPGSRGSKSSSRVNECVAPTTGPVTSSQLYTLDNYGPYRTPRMHSSEGPSRYPTNFDPYISFTPVRSPRAPSFVEGMPNAPTPRNWLESRNSEHTAPPEPPRPPRSGAPRHPSRGMLRPAGVPLPKRLMYDSSSTRESTRASEDDGSG